NADRQAKQLRENLEAELAENRLLTEKHQEQLKLLKERKAEQQEIRDSIRQLEEQLGRTPADIENEIESFKSLYIELMNEQATVRNELKNIDLQERQLSESTSRIALQQEDFSSELQKLEKEKEEAARKYETIKELLEEKRRLYRETENDYLQKKDSFDKKQSMLFQAYQSQKQLDSRIQTLQELEADFSGFFQGVREVLQAREKGQLAGVIGAVAEVAQVNQNYAKAIETALGASSQHIIVSNEENARQAINFLREKRAGRSTFLPMTVMKPRTIPEHT